MVHLPLCFVLIERLSALHMVSPIIVDLLLRVFWPSQTLLEALKDHRAQQTQGVEYLYEYPQWTCRSTNQLEAIIAAAASPRRL